LAVAETTFVISAVALAEDEPRFAVAVAKVIGPRTSTSNSDESRTN
jgi:hypothetical protein